MASAVNDDGVSPRIPSTFYVLLQILNVVPVASHGELPVTVQFLDLVYVGRACLSLSSSVRPLCHGFRILRLRTDLQVQHGATSRQALLSNVTFPSVRCRSPTDHPAHSQALA